jgi:hypothetical protein
MILSPFHSTLHSIASQYGIMYRFGLTSRSIFSRFRILTTYFVYSTIQERRLCIIPFAQCFFHIGLIIKHSSQYSTGHGRAASVSCKGWMPQNIPTIHKLLFIHSSINRQNRHHRAPCVLGIFQHSQRELQANPREDAQLLLVWNGWHPYPHEHQEPNEQAQHEPPQKVAVRSNTGTHTVT